MTEQENARTFPCKEPGCTELVTYQRQVVTGVVQLLPEEERRATPRRRVYLECSKEHRYPYEF
jgi:hypothetical protein